MKTPRFSILIPTRDRPATFRHTLASVASQAGEDYEIVIADNCSGAETAAIVQEHASPRLRHTRTSEILPMIDNWERGLSMCSGEYVTVLGDDDGFVPSTLAAARRLLELTGGELISWSPHTYWWADTIVHWNRNRLYVGLGHKATWYRSSEVLQRFFAGTISFGRLPMIYSSFVHRKLIEEGRRRHDNFLVPRDIAADIASGLVALSLTEKYVYSARPLSVRGNSGKSIGTAHWMRSLGAKQRQAFYRDERTSIGHFVHESLVPSPNLHIGLASAKLRVKETLFPRNDALKVDLHGVLKDMLAGLNFDPDAYEDNLEDARAFAAKLGVKLDPAEIPQKQPVQRLPVPWGPLPDEDGTTSMMAVNCEIAGVQDVAQAGRLADALLRPVELFPGK